MDREPGAPPPGVADALASLGHLLEGADEHLDASALQIARLADPDVDVDAALTELDRLAVGVTDVDGLAVRLYAREGFAGSRKDSNNPRNSSLVEVLARRQGIPITLAVLGLEVGRHTTIDLEPVGMQGRFPVDPRGLRSSRTWTPSPATCSNSRTARRSSARRPAPAATWRSTPRCLFRYRPGRPGPDAQQPPG